MGYTRHRPLIAGLLVAFLFAISPVPRLDAIQGNGTAPVCRPAGSLSRLQLLPEASGLAASRRVPGRLWTHNDSGEPLLYAIDARGMFAGRVRIAGMTVYDWEAIQSGPCPEGHCLYLADIGDNNGERPHISIYRVVEPESPDGNAQVAAVFHATFPGGARDAETLLIAPDGRLAIVTKGDTTLYRFPRAQPSGTTVRLERVGAAPTVRDGDDPSITDGDVSRDGRWVALRSHDRITFYPAAEFFAGKWTMAGTVDLRPLDEPQGEGLAFGPNRTIFVAGEGGGASRPGTLGRVTCSIDTGSRRTTPGVPVLRR
jgi:hypothetical protein